MSQQHTAARKLPDRSSRGSPRGTIQWKQANVAGSLPPIPTPTHESGARATCRAPAVGQPQQLLEDGINLRTKPPSTRLSRVILAVPTAAGFALCKQHPWRVADKDM